MAKPTAEQSARAALRTVDAVLCHRAALDGIPDRNDKLVHVFRELTRLNSDLAAMARGRDAWIEKSLALVDRARAAEESLAETTLSRDGWERDCKTAAVNYEDAQKHIEVLLARVSDLETKLGDIRTLAAGWSL